MTTQNVAQFLKTVESKITKYSPEILTGIGIAGMITTTVLAVRSTPKALRLLDDAKYEKGEDLTAPEKIKVCWKCYIPALVTGTTSVMCLIGSSSVSARRNAALATAYKLSETALTEYKEQVVETIGEKKEQIVREKVSQKQIDKNPVTNSEIIITGNGSCLCLDPLSKRYFESDRDRIAKAENELNKRMLHDICGSASLNEFYDEIGLDSTDIGEDLGWNTEHLIKLDIHPGLAIDGRPCLVISHYNPPKWDY